MHLAGRCSAVLAALTLAGCGSTAPGPVVQAPPGSRNASASTARTPAAATGPVVETVGLSFRPATLTVRVGETVTWRNTDGIPHTVTFGAYQVDAGGNRTSERPSGVFDKPLTGRNSEVTYTFSRPGTFPYYCKPHAEMNAKIIVRP